MANPTRTEVEIALDGKTYTLQSNFQALCEIEELTGLGVSEILRRVWDGALSVNQISTVIWSCIRAANSSPPAIEEVGEMVIAQGLKAFVEPVIRLLGPVVTGEAVSEERSVRKKK